MALLSVSSYYGKNKTIVVKLVLMTLVVGVLEAAGIFAIIPYVEMMFGDGEVGSYFMSELVELFPFLYDKVNATAFFLVFYLIRAITLATFVHKVQMVVGNAHAKLLSNLFLESFEGDVYSKEQSSELIRAYTRDSLVFVYAFLIQASVLVTELIIFIFLFFGIVYYQPEVVWLSPILIILVSLGYYLIKRRVSVWSKDVQKYDSKMIKNIQEVHSAHDEITIYQAFKGFEHRVNNIFHRKTSAYAKTESLMQMPRIMLETILVLLVVLSIYYVTQVHTSAIEPSIAVFIVLAGFRLLPMANKITQSLGWFRNGTVSLDALNKVYQHPYRNHKINISKSISSSEMNRPAVTVEDVTGNVYAKQKSKDRINFTANYGEITCIIGESGSGKSTLLRQLSGLIDVHGKITFMPYLKKDKKNKFDPVLSYVPQSPTILNDSIRANIVFMRDVFYDDITIDKSLEIVNLSQRVLFSTDGIEAILSESGRNLSGGEKYRVCLARALVNDPDILIMDEPTSSLDQKTSIEIIQNIRSFLPNAAIIISSHDQSIIELSNKIVKL